MMVSFLLLAVSLPWLLAKKLTNLAVPSNIDCENAQEVFAPDFSVDTTVLAENEFTNPINTCSTFSNYNLWFKYIADFSGYLQLSSCGGAAGYETLYSVYTACADVQSGTVYACNYGKCNGAAISTGTYANFIVESGETYYIAVGGVENDSGSSTTTLSQIELSLTLLTQSVSSSGGTVQFIASITAGSDFPIALNVDCGSGDIYIGEFMTFNGPQEFDMPSVDNVEQVCQVVVNDISNEDFTASADLTIEVVYSLTLTASPENPPAGSKISYSLYFTPPLVTQSQLEVVCEVIGQVQSETVSSTESDTLQQLTLSDNAVGPCVLQAIPTDSAYPNPNIVNINAFQQLSFSSESLNGWVAGQATTVNVASPNSVSVQAVMLTKCSIGSYSQQIDTSVSAQYLLPIDLNGVDCSVTITPPQYYLAPAPASVNIAIAPSQVNQIIRSFSFSSFLNVFNALVGGILN